MANINLNTSPLARTMVRPNNLSFDIGPRLPEPTPIDPVGAFGRGVGVRNALTRGAIDRNNLQQQERQIEQQNQLDELLKTAQTKQEIIDAVRQVNPLKALELEQEYAQADAQAKQQMIAGLESIADRFAVTPPEQHQALWEFYAQQVPDFAQEFPGGSQDPMLQALIARQAPQGKLTTKTFTDNEGNVVAINFDAAGNIVSRQNLGPIGKPGSAGTTVNVGGGDFKVPSGFMRDPNNPNAVVAIPGGPDDRMTPEQAAKTQLLEGGLVAFDEAMPFIFEGGDIEKGDVKEGNIVNMQRISAFGMGPQGMPFTEGRQARQLILDAVEAKLRAESGAAVPETEVLRMAQRFFPNPFDRDESIRSKMRRLRSFLEGTQEKILEGNVGSQARSEDRTVVIDGNTYVIINDIPYLVE